MLCLLQNENGMGVGADAEEEEEEEDEEEEGFEDEDFDEDEDGQDDSCPQGCDRNVFDKVLALREKRLDQEEMIQEVQKRSVRLHVCEMPYLSQFGSLFPICFFSKQHG